MSLFLTRQDYHDDFPEAFLHLVSTKRAKILFELDLKFFLFRLTQVSHVSPTRPERAEVPSPGQRPG